MKKLIRIEFELKNPQEVIINGYDEDLVKREIGCIFTPAGSGEYIINAIQICGFKEAYDFWGCARYQYPITNKDQERIMMDFEEKQVPFIQAKDIQLLFDVETLHNKAWGNVNLNECCRCYNKPCTCDNKVEGDYDHNEIVEAVKNGTYQKPKTPNPYNIKREDDVPILRMKEDLDCEYTYLDNVLIKKPKEKKDD